MVTWALRGSSQNPGATDCSSICPASTSLLAMSKALRELVDHFAQIGQAAE
jgi:hypothetical protein